MAEHAKVEASKDTAIDERTILKLRQQATNRWGKGALYRVLPPKSRRTVAKFVHKCKPNVGAAIGLIVLLLVVFDSVTNNWAINDFCGNGYQFRTPVARAATVDDLSASFTFGARAGISDLSNIGHWMADYVIKKLATDDSTVYVVSAGSYEITGPSMNYCRAFSNNYTVNVSKPVKLASAIDAVTFLRGTALTHAFTNDMTTNLPTATSTSLDLKSLGFEPTRVQTDMKMTTEFAVQNTSATQNATVTYYRLYAKSYCTGCPPIAELGRGKCAFSMKFHAATNVLTVTSTFALNSQHELGIIRKTIQWAEADPEKVETVWHKLVQIVAPLYFPHRSHALRLDLFCYNSDYFVLLYVLSVLLDMNHAIVFTREVNVFNQFSTQVNMTVTLFALSTRMLWLNVGLVKCFKLVVHLVSPAAFCGESRAMRFFNFSSVTTLYLTTILLFFVPEYIEYNNKSRIDIVNSKEHLDGQFVDFFESFYIRVAPAIGAGLLFNVLGVLVLDHVAFYSHWQTLKKNSLSRQAVYNSTSILCEFVDDVQTFNGDAFMVCSARRMSTLQWYFMHHLRCFGLPERELSKKKTATVTTKASEPPDGHEIKFTVGQDSNGHVHLYDDNLYDVKSLVLSVKVLRGTSLLIK